MKWMTGSWVAAEDVEAEFQVHPTVSPMGNLWLKWPEFETGHHKNAWRFTSISRISILPSVTS